MSLDRVPQGKSGSNLVTISTTLATPLEVPSFFQVGDDALDRALRDAHKLSNIAHPHLGLPRNAQQDVRVVGKKRPCRLWFSGGPSRRRPPCCRFLAPYSRCSQWVNLLHAVRDGIRIARTWRAKDRAIKDFTTSQQPDTVRTEGRPGTPGYRGSGGRVPSSASFLLQLVTTCAIRYAKYES